MMDRRAFLKSGGIALLTIGAGPAFLARTARATPTGSARRKVLVTIFQRGAMDGLMAVPPLGGGAHRDGALAKLRPRLAMGVGVEGVHDLGTGFGLHRAFDPLVPLWDDGRLAIVHAVGSPAATRSHFDAQDYMESGTPGDKGTPDGWLNRVAGLLGHDATPFRSVAMTAALPRSLYGDQPAIAVTDLRQFRVGAGSGAAPGTGSSSAPGLEGGFEALYDETSAPLLRDTAKDTFDAVDTLERLDITRYRPSAKARYPRSPLGRALTQIAFLIKSDVGVEVAFAESGGWDTHVRQGTANGPFARRSDDLARSIAAFWTDLGAHRDEVVLMTMTEFGRTVAENGSGGTDHGHGSAMFVLGNGIDGGRVHGRFPGLDPDALYEGRDLPVTTDFRSVFAAVAGQHLGIEGPDRIFPGWNGPLLPMMRRISSSRYPSGATGSR